MSKQEEPAIPAPSICEPVGKFEVVSRDSWNEARKELLEEEKALMKAGDRLIAKRMRSPVTQVAWVSFHRPGRRDRPPGAFPGAAAIDRLPFFYAPDVENWPEGACRGCSMFADAVVHPAHLAVREALQAAL